MKFVACLVLLNLPGAEPKPPVSVELREIQDRIADSDGKTGYYNTTYRKMELLYWQKLPGWMREDAQHRHVERILDIGCGYGTLLTLATRTYNGQGYCFDISDYLKPSFARAHNLAFARGNIELDPLPWREKFDVIIMTEVLEHFNFQPLPALKKIHAALVPGGVLFLSTPDARDWGRLTKYYKHLSDLPMPDRAAPVRDAHIWIYSERELSGLLDQAGFKISRLEYSKGNGNRHFNVLAVRR